MNEREVTVGSELFERRKEPILTKEDFPDDWRKRHGWTPHTVFNAGVGDRDGKTLLNVRVEDRRGKSRLVVFSSEGGIINWEIDENTIFSGDPKEEGYGVEDSRLTWMRFQEWGITYTHFSTSGPLVSIATTRHFKEFNYLGNVLPPENKDAALFPEPIKGYYYLIHRPVSRKKEIWIAKSKFTNSGREDLRSWGGHQVLITTDGSPWWDGTKIGLSAQPLKTEEGWLLLIHGVKNNLYRQGLAMLSLNDPTKLTHRTEEFVMSPQENVDFIGDVGGAIFSCGWRVHDNGDLRLYFGAADSVICFARAPLTKVIERVLRDPV